MICRYYQIQTRNNSKKKDLLDKYYGNGCLIEFHLIVKSSFTRTSQVMLGNKSFDQVKNDPKNSLENLLKIRQIYY
jgi:hypothetical protein